MATDSKFFCFWGATDWAAGRSTDSTDRNYARFLRGQGAPTTLENGPNPLTGPQCCPKNGLFLRDEGALTAKSVFFESN